MRPAGDDVELAPVWRRGMAGVIDIGLIMSGTGVVMAAGVGMLIVAGNNPAKAMERLEQLGKRVSGPLSENPWPQLLRVADAVATVGLRNMRSPGMRAMHIRRADARTGGPVTVRSGVIRQLARVAWHRLAKRVTFPAFERFQKRGKEAAAELDEFRRQHPDDPSAEATFYASRGNNPEMGSCCAWALVPIALEGLIVVVTPRRQGLSDWAAGIVVLRD